MDIQKILNPKYVCDYPEIVREMIIENISMILMMFMIIALISKIFMRFVIIEWISRIFMTFKTL